ncbi:MAG: o-succinylbenzoate--CoA ligase [Sulfobacillus acidophilus]|uniref:2-succinylbenzoate--CoA ligase n=1 Tax=Sulfobacillus acidophilus TaxID=53633 RepID=A0A2T2WIY7_9FIRM|nr:MAG: o-succinylbenzoate--CoA ligase [Sulfobacillus acidophilus]
MVSSPDWLHHQAAVHPQRLALVSPTTRWTFAELDGAVARLAGVLTDLGVGANDRIAYHLSATVEQVVLIHAVMRLHAVLVPLNTRLTPNELEPILANADPTMLIHDHALQNWPPPVATMSVQHLFERDCSRPVSDTVLEFDQLHALVYTSGTTATPKGVKITVGNQWWSAMGFALQAGLGADDRWLNVMPLFHVGGLTILFRSVIHGSTVYLQPRFDAATAHALMDEERITLVSVVPTMLHRWLELPANAPASLRLALLGGAPARRDLIERARQRSYPVVPTYGMTETCSQIVTLDVDAPPHPGNPAGHPNLPTQVRIVRNRVPVASEKAGEIWVQGPSVTPGYWRNPAATEAAFDQGWLKTGDLGFLDNNGYLTVVGRVTDTIIRGGENVYPQEVEERLLAFPGIDDAAVFGLADEEWGQRVAAALVCKEPVALGQLRQFLANTLAWYKIPSAFFRFHEIPRNPSGKILRNRIVQQSETMSEWVDT